MTEGERLLEVQAALAEMRADLREKAPNHATDAAQYLLAALKRRSLRVVTEDEWEDQFEQGEDSGRLSALDLPSVGEGEALERALLAPFEPR